MQVMGIIKVDHFNGATWVEQKLLFVHELEEELFEMTMSGIKREDIRITFIGFQVNA